MKIRSERRGDQEAIRTLTMAAFAPLPFSSNTEALIVDALRHDGDLAISHVAEENGAILGHVALFSFARSAVALVVLDVALRSSRCR